MAKPRKQVFTMKQYLENVKDGDISNDADTQRNPAWKPIVDGLVVTILTDDYVPALILAEDEGGGQRHIVDGGSRTTAFRMVRFGNYRIKSSVEDPIISYKAKAKDEEGNQIWIDSTFDIRNKTFDQFPKELQKKFDEYQVETVIHECDAEYITKYLRRYNIHSNMSTNQKMFIYLPNFAKKIRKIINRKFFIEYSDFSETGKEKGLLERVVAESILCMFHLNKWTSTSKKIAVYLNENSKNEEFEILDQNLERLEKIVTNETKKLFNDKDAFIWITLFNKFTNLGLEDSEFLAFMQAFIGGLREKEVEGKRFDTVKNDSLSTKNKSVVNGKLHILETLMKEFLHIEVQNDKMINNSSESLNKNDLENFLAQITGISSDVLHKNIDFYIDELNGENGFKDVCIRDGSLLLDKENNLSLLAMVAYAENKNENLEGWLTKYAEENDEYLFNQKENFLYMKEDFDEYLKGKIS